MWLYIWSMGDHLLLLPFFLLEKSHYVDQRLADFGIVSVVGQRLV